MRLEGLPPSVPSRSSRRYRLPRVQVRVAVKPSDTEDRAVLRVVSRALVDGDELRDLAGTRYGRVMEGLARQLRSKLHHDPLTGAYEIAFAVLGRD